MSKFAIKGFDENGQISAELVENSPVPFKVQCALLHNNVLSLVTRIEKLEQILQDRTNERMGQKTNYNKSFKTNTKK